MSPTWRWATTKGAGHDLEAEHAFGRRLFHPRTGQRPEALAFEIGGDAAQREQPREVLRLGQRGTVRQRAGEIFAEPGADIPGEGAGRPDPAPELLRAAGQPEGFEPRRAARRVLAEQHEVAQIGRQDQPVAPPVAADLGALRGEPRRRLRPA